MKKKLIFVLLAMLYQTANADIFFRVNAEYSPLEFFDKNGNMAYKLVGETEWDKPEILDKLDLDQLVDELADSLGVPPAIIRPDEAVEAMRGARQQAQQQQAQVEQAATVAQAANSLAGADMEGQNGLTEMLRAAGVR